MAQFSLNLPRVVQPSHGHGFKKSLWRVIPHYGYPAPHPEDTRDTRTRKRAFLNCGRESPWLQLASLERRRGRGGTGLGDEGPGAVAQVHVKQLHGVGRARELRVRGRPTTGHNTITAIASSSSAHTCAHTTARRAGTRAHGTRLLGMFRQHILEPRVAPQVALPDTTPANPLTLAPTPHPEPSRSRQPVPAASAAARWHPTCADA